MQRTWRGFVHFGTVGAVVTAVSCGPLPSYTPHTGDEASVAFDLGSTPFSGRSVRITAFRVSPVDVTTPLPADGSYRCLSSVTSGNCTTLDTSARASIPSLCASDNAPSALWNFAYELYSDAACQGSLLNPATGGAATCFDAGDLYSRQHPNASRARSVERGENSLAVACLMNPWQLAWVQRPTDTVAGSVITPAVTVQVQDVFGAPLPSAGLTVTLSIPVGPGTFTATSTTTAVTNAGGLATFANLVLDTPGTYTLRAASGTLLPVDAINIHVTPSPLTQLVYASTGPASTRTSTGTMTVTPPAGVVTNDLLLLIVVNSSNLASTTPADWTPLADASASSPTTFRLSVWWRLANGGTAVTLNTQTSLDGVSAWVVRYRRPTGYPPLPSTATATVRQGTANPAISVTPGPDLTTNEAGAVVISIVAARAANPVSLGTARSFNRVTATTSTPGQGVALGLADLQASAAGTTPASPTWTRSGSAGQWAFATVAFR